MTASAWQGRCRFLLAAAALSLVFVVGCEPAEPDHDRFGVVVAVAVGHEIHLEPPHGTIPMRGVGRHCEERRQRLRALVQPGDVVTFDGSGRVWTSGLPLHEYVQQVSCD